MTASRIRRDAKHIFECFLEVAQPEDLSQSPFIIQSFPQNYKDRAADKLQSVPGFTFPCQLEITSVQNFSFVLTGEDGKWTFGFCRVAPHSHTALVFLSNLPWHEMFYKMLNHAAELVSYHSQDELFRFLEASHTTKVPEFGHTMHITWLTDKNDTADFTAPTPHPLNLPSIPENLNLTEYFNAIKTNEMICMYAALLHERRIIITSKRLNRLTACVQAANLLLYPMSWQHIFIPVLPKHLIDYVHAPMPFLIGIPFTLMQRVKSHELGDAVILNADDGHVISPFDDVGSLPPEVKETLKKGLKGSQMLGDTVARAFLAATVQIIGGYKDGLKCRTPGEKIAFDEESFLNSRPPQMTPFLRQMLQLQLFEQFVKERLTLLNSGQSLSDEFETEVLRYNERSPQSAKLRNQAAQLKRDGGAIIKAVSKKANPAVRNAVRNVKEGTKNMQSKGKSAIRDIKSKIPNEMGTSALSKNRHGTFKVNNDHDEEEETRSAPSSPTMTSNGKNHHHGMMLTGNLVRNNTEMNIKARVLKYEKFDPPPVSSLSFTDLDKSPEMENLPQLDMNLLPELHDLIYRNNNSPNQNHQQYPQQQVEPPKVNRQLKPPLKRSNAEQPVIQHELMNAYQNTHEHSILTRQNAASKLGDTPDLDLIALGGPSNDSCADFNEDIIFDPLLEKETSSNHRPLQTSITNHQPLQRLPAPTNSRNPTNVHSTSSEDLLREYGLDFHQLSIHQQQQFPTSSYNNSSHHFGNSGSSSSSQQLNNLLEDLDPFRTTSLNHHQISGIGAMGRPQTTMITTTPTPPLTSHQPVAPPRVKRQSHQPTQNWTTFD